MSKVSRPSFDAIPAEFQESHRRQPVSVQDRVLRAYARTTEAVKRKEQEWKLRVELAEVAEQAVHTYVNQNRNNF